MLKSSPRSSQSRGMHKDISATSHSDKDGSESKVLSQITVAAFSKLDMAHESVPVIFTI